MRIEHLIDGKAIGSREYFQTVNPATQEVLAEVARGGAEEVNAAVAAAKAAFPAWAAKPAPERARLMRALGELITQHVPEISETETRDTGQVIGQTRRQLVPRAADNFHYFAEVCVRVDGHTWRQPIRLLADVSAEGRCQRVVFLGCPEGLRPWLLASTAAWTFRPGAGKAGPVQAWALLEGEVEVEVGNLASEGLRVMQSASYPSAAARSAADLPPGA